MAEKRQVIRFLEFCFVESLRNGRHNGASFQNFLRVIVHFCLDVFCLREELPEALVRAKARSLPSSFVDEVWDARR